MSETEKSCFAATGVRPRPFGDSGCATLDLASLASQRLQPGQLIPIKAIDHIHPDAMKAFFDLFDGMNEANQNGTGYSPKVAKAMHTLKMYFGEENYWRPMVDNNRDKIEEALDVHGWELFPATESAARDLYLRWCQKVE